MKQPFTIIIKVGKAISQKMSKNFSEIFLETYGKLHSFTVIMTAEEVNLVKKCRKVFQKNFLKLPKYWVVWLL